MENAEKTAGTVIPEPWNLWFRQAKNGDRKAAHNIITASQSIISSLSRNPLFRKRMSRDEIYSNANYALINFIHKPKELPEDAEVPYLLRYILKCALTDCVRDLRRREQFEQLAGPEKPDGAAAGDDFINNAYNAVAAAEDFSEQETYCLNKELSEKVRKAVQQLPENERTVIRGIYFQDKRMKEIAREMHCTFQNAYATRRKAYTHLHKILKNCGGNT